MAKAEHFNRQADPDLFSDGTEPEVEYGIKKTLQILLYITSFINGSVNVIEPC